MNKHPHFDLQLHSDAELHENYGKALKSRETVHEWPLSCVQILEFVDGSKRVYKSQAVGPSIEDRFYSSAKSSVLPKFGVLVQSDSSLIMDFEYIDSPLFKDLDFEEAEFVEFARSTLDAIGSIEGDLPVYIDLASVDRWYACFDGLFSDIELLISKGVFSKSVTEQLPKLVAIRDSDVVLDSLSSGSRLVHGDLNGDNVFYSESEIKVIDWQRPVKAPTEVDLVSMLLGRGISPSKYVEPEYIAICYFLRLLWSVESQKTWLPEGSYEGWVINSILAVDDEMGNV